MQYGDDISWTVNLKNGKKARLCASFLHGYAYRDTGISYVKDDFIKEWLIGQNKVTVKFRNALPREEKSATL